MQEQQYMTRQEVMAGLRVSRETVLRMIRRGDLEGSKTHSGQQGRWRITVASYRRFVKSENS